MMERYSQYKPSGIQWIGDIPSHWEVEKLKVYCKENKEKNKDNKESTVLSLSYGNVVVKQDLNAGLLPESYDTYQIVNPGYIILRLTDLQNDHKSLRTGLVENRGIITNAYVGLKIEQIDSSYTCFLLHSFDIKKLFYSMGGGLRQSMSYKDIANLLICVPPLPEQEKIVSYLDKRTSKIDEFVAEKEKEIQLLNELKQTEIANVVTRGLNPNVKMKDSGIAWIGMIPEHWEVKQLRAFLKLFSEKGHGDAQLLSVIREQGVIIRDKDNKEENHNFVPDDLSGYKYIEVGDFVINKMKAWQGSYAVSSYSGIVSPAYFTCKLKGVNKDFFSLAIRSKAYVGFFTSYSKGIRVGQWDLDPNALKAIPFFLPPLSEQKAIATHIEQKCAKANSLISEIESEITYLKEYKQRLIADCVTGQINVQNL